MTSDPPLSSYDDLRRLVAGVRAVLLDFDGPICTLFAEMKAADVAADLRGTLTEHGVQVPSHVEAALDPLEVLSFTATHHPDLAEAVEAAMSAAELHAAATAVPNPGLAGLLAACRRTGRRLAVVSNNSEQAVLAYLKRHAINDAVDAVVARTSDTINLLKPHPHLVATAAQALRIDPAACLLVGDSENDLHAGRAAGVITVGYANKPHKCVRFLHAKADAVTDSLKDLAHALA